MSKVAGADQKELGNQYFAERKYDLAISSYTDAIVRILRLLKLWCIYSRSPTCFSGCQLAGSCVLR